MTSGIDAPKRRYLSWLRPFHVVLLGTVVIAILLLAPIRIGPGNHEKDTSCGSAFDMDLSPWRSVPHDSEQAYYLDLAYKTCTIRRIDRLAQAVGVLSVTFLIVAFMTRRSGSPRSDRSSGGPDPS
ncbi:hypothetical protein GCM10027280_20490 [Micromonospora polyrhachis]|uniref:Uncharacterized protein n=1 Tax=Micromonospora polyrhachis TaxID=1282883 RepID=A0A7W7SVH6_9ACTN|nr:hypothetical protein [Micromonospora polyrhachis]MBB4961735.1 hypothetical protein [Micromonospora polyrhachis]